MAAFVRPRMNMSGYGTSASSNYNKLHAEADRSRLYKLYVSVVSDVTEAWQCATGS